MTLYTFLHLNNDLMWLDAYDAESLAKAIIAARRNHIDKPNLQLIYINTQAIELAVDELTQ